jgi:hypothetical protein
MGSATGVGGQRGTDPAGDPRAGRTHCASAEAAAAPQLCALSSFAARGPGPLLLDQKLLPRSHVAPLPAVRPLSLLPARHPASLGIAVRFGGCGHPRRRRALGRSAAGCGRQRACMPGNTAAGVCLLCLSGQLAMLYRAIAGAARRQIDPTGEETRSVQGGRRRCTAVEADPDTVPSVATLFSQLARLGRAPAEIGFGAASKLKRPMPWRAQAGRADSQAGLTGRVRSCAVDAPGWSRDGRDERPRGRGSPSLHRSIAPTTALRAPRGISCSGPQLKSKLPCVCSVRPVRIVGLIRNVPSPATPVPGVVWFAMYVVPPITILLRGTAACSAVANRVPIRHRQRYWTPGN